VRSESKRIQKTAIILLSTLKIMAKMVFNHILLMYLLINTDLVMEVNGLSEILKILLPIVIGKNFKFQLLTKYLP